MSAVVDVFVVLVLDLHDLIAGGEGPTETVELALAGGVQLRLKFDVQRAGSDATAVHRAQHPEARTCCWVADPVISESYRGFDCLAAVRQ
jgi:hypothetical protein